MYIIHRDVIVTWRSTSSTPKNPVCFVLWILKFKKINSLSENNTLPPSVRLVSMIISDTSSCQIISQWSTSVLLFGPSQIIDLFMKNFRLRERNEWPRFESNDGDTDLGMLYISYSRHSPMKEINSLLKVNRHRTRELEINLMPIHVEC